MGDGFRPALLLSLSVGGEADFSFGSLLRALAAVFAHAGGGEGQQEEGGDVERGLLDRSRGEVGWRGSDRRRSDVCRRELNRRGDFVANQSSRLFG